MTIFHSIILGAIEGITEFLPVSSTAHLIVGQKLLGLSTVNEFFTTVVQLGAIAGLIVSEKNTIMEIVNELLHKKGQLQETVGFQLALASIPVLLVGFLIKDHIAALQNNSTLIAFMSVAVGIVLYIAERYAKTHASSGHITLKQLFVMGIFQCLSLIPGTSRSGITAAGGAFQKLSLVQALEYSFLLSIPALLAAGGYEVLKATQSSQDPTLLLPTFIATIVAFATSMLAIDWLRRIVRERGFLPFVLYRILFGCMILLTLQ